MDDIDTFCRICLSKKQPFIDMFDLESDQQELPLKIALCLSILVKKNDKKSKHICLACVRKLHIYYEFRQRAINSENCNQLQ